MSTAKGEYEESVRSVEELPVYSPRDEQQLGRDTSFPTFSSRGMAQKERSQIRQMDSMVDSPSFKFVHEFFEANPEIIASRSENIADNAIDLKDVEEALNGFTETAQTLIKGLTALGNIHPFIGVAVGAFVLVVTLDLSRRENDRKVVAVKVQMQDLMVAFFDLGNVRDSQEQGDDGLTVAERLQGLISTIAEDIKACGSACDAYMKKSILAKTIKSGLYESRLAEFGLRFVEHRKKFLLTLALHTAVGVDTANQKLDHLDHRLQSMEKKFDMILLFRKLDTPRERDVQKFIDDNGGTKECIGSDELLEELIAKSGENLTRISGRETGRRSNDLPEIRKRLWKELQEDIDDAFHRNLILFERKMDMQSKQLSDTVQKESEHIISTLLSGAHDRIIDPDLQRIWKDMGWKGSVKARHFVLALHDYYTDRLTSSAANTPTVDRSSFLSTAIQPVRTPTRSPSMIMKRHQDDRWALSYINAAYVQPILEAVDDDGTGFVSVKEVNDFVSSRPASWSLPHWIAYWAASISHYKSKIYLLIQTMFKTLEYVLPSNRRAVDEYLFHPSFWRIELLLRSTRSANRKVLLDPDLSRIIETYASSEEERIDTNLRGVAYELDTPATVSLITGVGRIERYVFPLIYLLLRRHLKVMTLACKHVLDTEEFTSLNDSLVSVLLAVDYRIQNLEAVFKQTHLDVQARLGNFAFGLFQLSYGDIKRVPVQNSFSLWTNEEDPGASRNDIISHDVLKPSLAQIPLQILKYGIQDGYSSTDYYEFEAGRMNGTEHPIHGTWAGHYSRLQGKEPITFVLRVSIRTSTDYKTIMGKGEDYSSTFQFSGNISDCRKDKYDFMFAVEEDDLHQRSCTGLLDTSTDTITAYWSDKRARDAPEDVDYQRFKLRRLDPSLLRYRYTEAEFAEDPVRSRWAFACSAALHLTQKRLWSRRFFQARFSERRRFVELTTRSLVVSMGLTPQAPLTAFEARELERLRKDLNPSEARFYQALSSFEIQKMPWHPTWGCDSCERRITKARIICIQCMNEDLSDNIELCGSCIDKSPRKRGFSHDAVHDILRVEQTLHDCRFAKVVETARTILTRIKAAFRNKEPFKLLSDKDHQGHLNKASVGGSINPSCRYCRKSVLPPCWVCVVCTNDIFICQECTPRGLAGETVRDGHTLAHPLVRVLNSSDIDQNATSEERISSLERRLANLEFKLTEGFFSMESKLEQQVFAIESKIEQRFASLEGRVEARFNAMEATLHQIAAQTSALLPIHGQVSKESFTSSDR